MQGFAFHMKLNDNAACNLQINEPNFFKEKIMKKFLIIAALFLVLSGTAVTAVVSSQNSVQVTALNDMNPTVLSSGRSQKGNGTAAENTEEETTENGGTQGKKEDDTITFEAIFKALIAIFA
jgi:opacity protein-like surface antigen